MAEPGHKYFRYGTQARRIYDLLSYGPATGDQIVRQTGILNYHKIIGEIRKRLDGSGVTVKASPRVNGRRNLWEYRLGFVGVQTECSNRIAGSAEARQSSANTTL
jgi:hypothetical protein